jgi:hypothetical protein
MASSLHYPEKPGDLHDVVEADGPDAVVDQLDNPAAAALRALTRRVSDEEPPLPNEEEPPLPDEEEPPVPDEEPPLPQEEPPLPSEQPPDDGWDPVWDPNFNAFYFYNRFTKASQWDNPRIPSVPSSGLGAYDRMDPSAGAQQKPVAGGYIPAIHGDYDPNADYAQGGPDSDDEGGYVQPQVGDATYEATGAFNRFTGRWQNDSIAPENYNDENKSNRQMNAFFDVVSTTNANDGRSLKAERQSKKLTRKEIKAFKDKRRERKEEKRRAWLRD